MVLCTFISLWPMLICTVCSSNVHLGEEDKRPLNDVVSLIHCFFFRLFQFLPSFTEFGGQEALTGRSNWVTSGEDGEMRIVW